MNKFTCFGCNEPIKIEQIKPFDKINCPNCSLEVTVPKIIGSYVAVEKLSENPYYTTYKGFESNSEKDLVFKVVRKSKDFDQESFLKMKTKLSRVPDGFKYSFSKTEDSFLFIRNWYETSVQKYLKSARPQLEKVQYLLKGSATILDECSKQNIYPVELVIGNLLIGVNGEVVLSDILFKESISECFDLQKSKILASHCIGSDYLDREKQSINNSLFSFGCLFYYICCDSYPWPKVNLPLTSKVRKIQPEILLNLRDKDSKVLKGLLKKLIDENSKSFSDFESVIKSLESKPPSKKVAKKPNLKPSNKLSKVKRRRVSKSNSVPLIAVCLVSLLVIVAFTVLQKNKVSPQTAKVTENKKDVTPPKKPKKKVIKKAPEAKKIENIIDSKIEVVEIQEVAKKPVVDRELIKAELIPPDFNFDPLVNKLDEYIDATEEAQRELEEDKIEYVSTYRDHLLVHFYKRPYKGIFYIQKNKPFTGKILKADENNIHIINDRTKKTLVAGWKDFEFNQFNEFADYYAAARYANDFSLSDNNSAVFSKIAKEYSKFAVVLDWYGFNKDAIEYKRKALKLDPSLIEKLDELIKEEPTN